ncbi:Mitochondrial import receptor subunit [Venturia inaequalis]|nr:Mitochondrial import receptor subunit [Venturia inaequalis]
MKLTSTLLLCLGVNSVAAHWKCYKQEGTPGYCSPYGGTIYYGPPPQMCRKASPCNKRDDSCTPNKFKEPGTGIQYANCDEGGGHSSS